MTEKEIREAVEGVKRDLLLYKGGAETVATTANLHILLDAYAEAEKKLATIKAVI